MLNCFPQFFVSSRDKLKPTPLPGRFAKQQLKYDTPEIVKKGTWSGVPDIPGNFTDLKSIISVFFRPAKELGVLEVVLAQQF